MKSKIALIKEKTLVREQAKAAAEVRDLAILNDTATRLNQEAADVLIP